MTRQTMRSVSGSAAALVTAVTLSACGSTTEAERAHDQLHLWRERKPASYVYASNSYQLRPDSLFFDVDVYGYGSWRVVVENGNAVSVSDFNGRPVSDPVTTIDGLMKRVIFYMEDAGYTPDDYEATYDDRWGYVKHFWAGVDDAISLDIDCFMPGTSDDACPVREVAKEDCSTAPVTVPILSFAESESESIGSSNCELGQAFSKVQGEDQMCCHSR